MSGLLVELKRRNVIRVGIAYLAASWLLVQVAETVLPLFGVADAYTRTLVIALAIGFVPTLILSWVFELTPEGIKKEKDVDRSQSITHSTGRRLDFVIIAVLVAALGFFAFDKFVLDPERDATREAALREQAARVTTTSAKSVAVLPFVAMSTGKDDGYFADGLTEEILNSLASLPELKVTARTSSFHFKGTTLPIPEIAASLGVANMVEGSVRRDGERVRITAQLIRADDGFHLWSDTYDRTLEDVFAVQRDIAENIAEVLDVVLDEETRTTMERSGIRDVDAFIAHQKGIEAFALAHEDVGTMSASLARANEYFTEALEVMPGLTRARVMRSDRASHAVFEIAAGFRKEVEPGEAEQALTFIEKEYETAWRLAPNGSQRDVVDVERTQWSDDWTGLSGKLDRALQPADCPQANWMYQAAGLAGRAGDMADFYAATLECDPYHPVTNFSRVYSLIWAGRAEEALQQVQAAEDRGIRHPWLDDGRYWALLSLGQIEEADVHTAPPGSVMMYSRQTLFEAAFGDIKRARQLAEQYWSSPNANDWSSLIVAGAVGDRERANEFAARIDSHPASAIVLGEAIYQCYCGAPFDLEVTPNFKRLVEQAGFPWPPPSPITYPAKTWGQAN